MNKLLKTILCTYCIISVSYATPPSCLDLHQSQLNTLNERMNQMLSALYSSPILSKLKTVTNPESSPETTATVAETPESVYDNSAYAPTSAGVTPQVVYLPASNTPSSDVGSSRTARSYYQPDVPLEYLMSPWSQYYDPYRSAFSHSYPSTLLQNPLASLYDPYREYYSPAPYLPYIPPTYPTIPPPALPALPTLTPPTYSTPPPIYQTNPPVYQTPSAYKTLPPTYQTQPPCKSPLPAYPSPPPPYQVPPASYQTPPPSYPAPSPSYPIPPTSYQTPPPAYNTPPPTYNTPPPIYSPSSPITPYSLVRYSRAVEYSPYYPQTPL